MDSSFFLTTIAAAIGFFTLFRKFRFHQENKEVDSSSSSHLSTSLVAPYPSVAPSPLSHNFKHQVFPSFHGSDVRKAFLSHFLKEFRRKGIEPFIDNNIERSKSLGPKIIEAIRGSKIAIVLLSSNYASSSWCLNELVEIMKCRDELGQAVMTVFYEVDPTNIRKQTGDFGSIFLNTCVGKPKEDIRRWRQALSEVATIAGYHSSKWDNEAAMIEKITTDISNMLNSSTPSNDFNGLVGMRAHIEKMELLLQLNLDEVRMIGIWGPSGIGKTTIARVLFNQYSDSFDLSVFMENIKAFMHTRPASSDDYCAKLNLHKHLISRILNQKDIEVPHLGVAQERLKDKRVLVILDDVDQSAQLDAMAKETWWFGSGSRIIITTQDKRLLRAHGVEDIYNVDYPSTDEALQIFCMNAFGQHFPKDGFEELALEVTRLSGELPLGLKIMGSYLRRMSKEEWKNELPRLRRRLDGEIESILKLSYDALCEDDKNIFLHIACLFNNELVEKVENHLAKSFLSVTQGFQVLAEKSLISIESRCLRMHNLLEQFGREIVRKQSVHEPGRRQFLVDAREICEMLAQDTGSSCVIGIKHSLFGQFNEQLGRCDGAFEKMSNLQFLRVRGPSINSENYFSPRSVDFLSRKLQLLDWTYFPMTCLPSKFHTDFLVELNMVCSNLEKLWEGNRPLRNLKWMDLTCSENLKELPDLSTATNLLELNLRCCSNLVELPYSLGNATNLQKLNITECSSLVEVPSSIGNLQKLESLDFHGCSKLESLPANINLKSLNTLSLVNCSRLKTFPEISTNITRLLLSGTAIKEVPSSISSWPHLEIFFMSYFENLEDFPHALERITALRLTDTRIHEVSPWISKMSRLSEVQFDECKELISLPQFPDSLSRLYVSNCESLERLDCSFHRPHMQLVFFNCFKLNKEARDLIIQASLTNQHVILPGGEVPACFTYRAPGGSLAINLNEGPPLRTSLRFIACILLSKVAGDDVIGARPIPVLNCCIVDKNSGLSVRCRYGLQFFILHPSTEHIYTFAFEADVTSSKLVFKFTSSSNEWDIRECGVLLYDALRRVRRRETGTKTGTGYGNLKVYGNRYALGTERMNINNIRKL